MAPLRVLVSGATGRMGSTVGRLVADATELDLAGGLDREPIEDPPPPFPRVLAPSAAAELVRSVDAIIDFSAPPLLRALLEEREDDLRGRALVVGTTGLGPEELRLLDRASEASAVLVAANFSVGVNLLLALVERTARALGPEFDVEIVETHHRKKEDAPSGTALALGEAVAAGRGIALEEHRQDGRTGRPGPRPAGEIGLHALRGGDVIGDHHVHFIGDLERIELSHRAVDRALFAAGAVRAALWLAGRKPGRYSMRQMLGID